MGLILFVLFSVLEIVLAVKGRGKEKEKKVWLKNRLFVRLAEIAVVLIALLLPFGQKWRLVPLLGFLALLALIALLKWLDGRKKEGTVKKTGTAVFNCVFSILFIGLLLVPAFVVSGYKGLPGSGEHPVHELSAILLDYNTYPEYKVCYLYTPVLIIAVVMMSFNQFLSSVYVATQKTSHSMWTALIAAGTNIILNVLLIYF